MLNLEKHVIENNPYCRLASWANLFGYDRDEEHEAFLSWLIDILTLRQTDVLLIAGDVFDVANPSAAAQRRFFRFLRKRTGVTHNCRS